MLCQTNSSKLNFLKVHYLSNGIRKKNFAEEPIYKISL